MNIKTLKTAWGHNLNVEFLDQLAPNFQGLEIAIQFAPSTLNVSEFNKIRKEKKLDLCTQIHTCRPGAFISQFSVQNHIDSFKKQIELALNWKPAIINCHSGLDKWSLDEKIKFYQQCAEIEKQLKLTIVHETHRQRALYSAFETKEILKHVKDLKLNLDVSHWVVVHERLFDDQYDIDWHELLQNVSENSHLIHARVATPQQIQVPDFTLPEYQDELKWFKSVWQKVINTKKSLNQDLYMTAEFGPYPYMPIVPYTQAPIIDLNLVNLKMAQYIQQQFKQ